MRKLLDEFETACADASVDPVAALEKGGVHRSLWKKWKDGNSPTLRNFERAMEGLEVLKRGEGQRAA